MKKPKRSPLLHFRHCETFIETFLLMLAKVEERPNDPFFGLLRHYAIFLNFLKQSSCLTILSMRKICHRQVYESQLFRLKFYYVCQQFLYVFSIAKLNKPARNKYMQHSFNSIRSKKFISEFFIQSLPCLFAVIVSKHPFRDFHDVVVCYFSMKPQLISINCKKSIRQFFNNDEFTTKQFHCLLDIFSAFISFNSNQ